MADECFWDGATLLGAVQVCDVSPAPAPDPPSALQVIQITPPPVSTTVAAISSARILTVSGANCYQYRPGENGDAYSLLTDSLPSGYQGVQTHDPEKAMFFTFSPAADAFILDESGATTSISYVNPPLGENLFTLSHLNSVGVVEGEAAVLIRDVSGPAALSTHVVSSDLLSITQQQQANIAGGWKAGSAKVTTFGDYFYAYTGRVNDLVTAPYAFRRSTSGGTWEVRTTTGIDYIQPDYGNGVARSCGAAGTMFIAPLDTEGSGYTHLLRVASDAENFVSIDTRLLSGVASSYVGPAGVVTVDGVTYAACIVFTRFPQLLQGVLIAKTTDDIESAASWSFIPVDTPISLFGDPHQYTFTMQDSLVVISSGLGTTTPGWLRVKLVATT